ncbi:MAG: TIGR03016 family PEP-CTERM system-associated outer membrane protein [Desulfomicrobium sp.]|nr:TIGR03016 family PEP-CTERM system-associated outer membrane protein [Desulfomicrobium sp.]
MSNASHKSPTSHPSTTAVMPMHLLRHAVLVALFLSMPLAAFAEEPAWKASLSVGEEYNDNVDEEKSGRDDFITSVRPSLSYVREGERLLFESAYSGDYRFYAKGTEDQEFNHNLRVHALLDAWENFLFLDLTDTYRLVNEDRTRGEVVEDDSTQGLVQQNTFTFSPYITPRFGERGQAKIGYAFSNIWYEDSDNDGKDIHRGFVDTDYELTDRAALLSGYSYTQELSEDETLHRHIAYLGGRYAYAEKGSVFLKAGPQYTRYEDRGTSSTSLYWDAGLDHDFGAVQLNLTSGISFEDDPDTGQTYERRYGTLRLSKAWERTTASVSTTLEDYEENSGVDSDGESVRRTVIGLNLSRELTSRLTGTLGLSHDFEDSDDNTKRWYANLGLTYALSEKLSLGGWYRFKDSTSDDVDEEFRVNRVGVQVTYLF